MMHLWSFIPAIPLFRISLWRISGPFGKRFGTVAGIDPDENDIGIQSKRVALVLHGRDKCHAFMRLAECGRFVPEWPASVIFSCRHPEIFVTEEVAVTVDEKRLRSVFHVV